MDCNCGWILLVSLVLLHQSSVSTAQSDLLKPATVERRRLTRFRIGHEDNNLCWERHGVDGFISPVDAHNHFRPFYGPPVPWDTYMSWMKNHGILFTTMLGIGQQLLKRNPSDPDCCYYLHCATYDYPVTPDPINDERNAQDYKMFYENKDLEKQIHLIPSVTFPNLQQPENNTRILEQLKSKYQGVFGWAGEINVFKHALAANGFFANGKRVSEARLKAGELDGFFRRMEDMKWPVTLHCDLGCDNYDSVPWKQGCFVPDDELELAAKNYRWWQEFLGPHFRGFFDKNNKPKQNFKKIQHLKIWDTLLERYPNMIVVWAHLGLSKELKHLHPKIHVYIITKLLSRHNNLHLDVSWDVIAKQLFMNVDQRRNVTYLHHDVHEDFQMETEKSIVDTAKIEDAKVKLEGIYALHEETVRTHGSVAGPTHAMAIYLEMFHDWDTRFVTGTDFVSSMGPGSEYPGLKLRQGKPANGCMKDKANHARQVTDTSTPNMFLNDEAFRKIVLGENYFRINRLSHTFKTPPVCGDTVLSTEVIVGIGIGGGVVVVVALVVVAVLLFSRNTDGGSFIRMGAGGSATTNV